MFVCGDYYNSLCDREIIMNIVYRVEYLLENNSCGYKVKKYSIDRKTANFVWATWIDDKIIAGRELSVKFSKKTFYWHGVFNTYEEVVDKICSILLIKINDTKEVLQGI